ncbi:hypothetical protein [Tabrizicola sp.]|jgi:hypothetical protein|nr:hypothetical protein [Tabrizicola sp.]MBL9062051.1 hypothetical protein [Tabrizicola sp.]
MTGMDLGAQPSYPARMIRIFASFRDRTMAGFPHGSALPRALARLA